ncbi:MAG TPA: response regulator transcription factor [Planctomycetota bacterium]|nr:response regulator transcription factor [Planctomycetota bacterium]
MTKILIADDHAILRQGLKQILADEWPGAQFGEAGTAAEALQLIWEQRWDAVVLDINMPGRSGLEVLRETRQRYPDLPVLVLSSTPEDQLAVRVLRAGASGYLNKQTAPEELVNAMRKVMSGGRYVSAALAEQLAADVSRAGDRPRHEFLSDREYQVFEMTVAGKSVKGIAAELSLSVKTISTFRTRVFEKLGVSNDVELVHYAAEHGLGGGMPPGVAPRS